MRVSEDIRKIKPYVPGKPIEETKRELGLSDVYKLASNENPLGPSPLALKAILRELSELNRYPDGSCFALRQRLAKHYKVEPDWLFFGNGSDEIIDILIHTFCDDGDSIMTSHGAFSSYKIAGQAARKRVVEVPMGPGFRFN